LARGGGDGKAEAVIESDSYDGKAEAVIESDSYTETPLRRG